MADRIELRIAPAIETLRALPTDEPIDLVFIDADKPGYVDYWEELVPGSARVGCCWPTTCCGRARSPTPDRTDENTEALRAFNDRVAADDRVERRRPAGLRRADHRPQALRGCADNLRGATDDRRRRPAQSCSMPRCSKCRQARDLLAEQGVEADYVHYLEDTPSRDEIVRIYGLLGIHDPRQMMRTGEPPYRDAGADRTRTHDALFDAMVAHPILIERPIVIRGDRAVVARPAGEAARPARVTPAGACPALV